MSYRNIRRPRRAALKLLLAALAVAALLAVACGAPDATPTPTTAAPASRATPTPTPTLHAGVTPAPTPSPSPGQSVRGELTRLWADPPTLDPHLTRDATSALIIVEVFSGLVTFDTDLKLVPDIAETWDISPDGTVYTFRLRQDARFHDGKPITAEDFRWSIERAADPATQSTVAEQYLGDIVGVKDKLRGKAKEISGLKVLDQRTLQLTIDAPKSYFLDKLTYPTAFVLDRANVEGKKDWTRQPNGAGPFKLASYTPGERVTLERNASFHLGPPKLERVKLILSGGTSMLMYENGEIDVTSVGLADIDRVLDTKNPLNKELVQAPTDFSTDYIGMNVKAPPFDDVKVRQALNYAVDKDQIAKLVLGGLVVPAKGILPPGFPAYNPNLKGYTYDPEKAKQLLAESKYGKNMKSFPRIIITVSGSLGSAVGLDLEAMLEMWQKNLGITVDVQQTEYATFLKDLERRRFQMFEIGWIADYPHPENFLDVLFHSASPNNHGGYSNPDVDKLLEQARVEQDETKRNATYQQIEQMIVDDAPWIPMWHTGERYVLVKPYVKDYRLTPMVVPKLRHVYIAK